MAAADRELVEALRIYNVASRRLFHMPRTDPGYRRARAEFEAALSSARAVRQRIASEFGAARGWRLSRTAFGLVTLSRGMVHAGWHHRGEYSMPRIVVDHPTFFRRSRWAAAIASHVYDWPQVREEAEALASCWGLDLEVPDFSSWWSPGATTLTLFIGPVGRRLQ